LYAVTIFIAIEGGHYDSANGMLDKAMSYKNFLRQNEPFYYGVLCFLYAYLELNQKRARSAKKHRRAFADHIAEQPSLHYTVMLGLIHLAAGEFPEAYKFLSEALAAGSNSIFLYEGLYRYYKNASSGFEGMSVLPVLTYAAQRGADISDVALKYSETLSAAIAANPEAGEKLYEISKYPPILKDICANRIAKGDMSAQAFAYYRDAEKKQIYTPELFNALVRASYENNAQRINHYPMARFLNSVENIQDLHFAVYVYHFLLSDPALSDLLPEVQSKILQLGTRCLENDINGREANSIYYFLWSRLRALGISGAPPEKAEEILRANLTFFELRVPENSDVRFVYITEPEKRGMEVYEITQQVTQIEAVCASASYTCFGAGQRTIIDEELEIKPMVGQAAPELYLYFFQKGDRRFHLLAYLANYYLQLDSPPDEAAPIFEALLAEKNVAKPYKMRILIALGRLHYNAFSFEQALECYGEVDENAIADDFIEQVLNVYLQTREYKRAEKLICAKHKHISNETLFNALEILLTRFEKSETLAAIGYNLLLNGFFGEELLKFVLNNFSASFGEWAELAQVIDENNRNAPSLDARVLESALHMACFDINAQKSFARLYETNKNDPLIAAFTELAAFEMLAKSTRPNYDVLNILEKIFFEKDQPTLLSWGIAGVYLRHNITTFKSDEIIRCAINAAENEGILFPVFKENMPMQIPFIEKFTPFMYNSLPEKNCWLYYRIEGDEKFSAIQLQYVRYGLYVAAIPIFYNEAFEYYFSEEMASGSITTKVRAAKNTKPFLHEDDTDPYFTINNAIINEQMFKHDRAEKLISRLVKDIQPVRAQLL
jgi:lipopolysaccharide biosynthesis regulator YciM